MKPNRPIPKATFGFSIFIGLCSLAMAVFYKITQIRAGSTEGESTFIAFLILGLLFVLLGIGSILVANRLNSDATDSIIAEGNYIMADVDQVIYATEIDDREPVNSTHGIFHTPVEEDYDETAEVHHPYIIYCHYINSQGKRKDYIVPNVWVSPYPYLEKHNNQVKVYIKGNNINKYRFDLTMFEEDV